MPRSDKKIEVKAVLHPATISTIDGLSNEQGTTSRKMASRLAFLAANDLRCIRSIAPWFQRGWCKGHVAFIGHRTGQDYTDLVNENQGSSCVRYAVKFTQDEWESIDAVAAALACPGSQAVTILLVSALFFRVWEEQNERSVV